MPIWLILSIIGLLLLGVAGMPFAFGAMMAYGAPESVMGANPAATKLSLLAIIVFPAVAWAGAFAAWRFHGVGAGTGVVVTSIIAPLLYLALALAAYDGASRAGAAPLPNAPAEDAALRAYIAANPALEELRLVGLGLTDVPPAVFTATSVKRIDLSQNKITRIPDELGRLPKLELIRLNGNPITAEEEKRWLSTRQNQAALNTSAQ
ncbi:MAG TPA: hypothetical protein DCL54_10655 [Alphaproteobacteria bacterium]|nr:hypothetical protein [Alphaproteobacteria bacterium]HAJ47028.1 hypothetical protein [Alphaproteobacteria bacterium]